MLEIEFNREKLCWNNFKEQKLYKYNMFDGKLLLSIESFFMYKLTHFQILIESLHN